MVYGDEHVFRQHEAEAPSVFGPEHIAPEDDEGQVPATVYLPSEPVTDRHAEVTLELRTTHDNSLAMLAFTSQEELVAGCGDGQFWVAVRGHQVEELRERSGADMILWDAAIPIEERKTQYQEGNP